MDSDETSSTWWISAVRWTARVMSLGLAGLLLVFFFGEGGWNLLISVARAPLVPEHIMTIALFFVAVPGLLAAWKWEIAGGVAVLVGAGVFHAVDWVVSGSFPDFPFTLFFVAGLLYLAAGSASHLRQGRDTMSS